jgi:CheY-like chemotaxis protein
MNILNNNTTTQPSDGEHLPRLRLVVIDDNESSSEMLKRILELGHHEVHVAGTGLEGIELIKRVAPDLALVDIGLPDISGYEVAKRVREDEEGRTIFLAAVTGHVFENDVEEARVSGFDAHASKPLDNQKLSMLLFAAARQLEEDSA